MEGDFELMGKINAATLNLRNIYFLISKLLVFFIIFDNARMGLAIPQLIGTVISLFRDFFLFAGLLILFSVKRKILFPKFLFFIFLFFPIALYICIANIITGLSETSIVAVINGIYWNCRPILIFLIFYNLENVTGKNCTCFVNFFLTSVVILFFVSAFLYFFAPFLLNKMYFKFRVSLGNPSMIAAEYNAAAIVILYFRPFPKLKNFIFLTIYVIACLFTMCATANFIMVVILIIGLLNRKTRIMVLPIFVVFFTVVVVFFQTKQTKLLLEFIQKRILEISSVVTKYVFHNSDSINSDSFRGREAQLSKMLKTYPKYGFIFGIGDISGTGGKYSLENIYMATFSNYGFFGLALYVGFLILVFLKSIFYLLYKKQSELFMFAIFLALYGLTLDLINTYSLSGIFVLSGLFIFNGKQFCFYKQDNSLFHYSIISHKIITRS